MIFNRFTERARKVMSLAQEEAKDLRHNYVGTEHLLLGLIREGEGVAAKVLKNSDLSLESLQDKVRDMIGEGKDEVTGDNLPFTPRTKKVLNLALEEAHLVESCKFFFLFRCQK